LFIVVANGPGIKAMSIFASAKLKTAKSGSFKIDTEEGSQGLSSEFASPKRRNGPDAGSDRY